ncbi:hypothetical protein [Methylobacterium nonmethylotrophicum]|uniref:Uncharacterized protein n=1 Tax=Methylobacterium nonmethylotrophicum TaxID=1141884 RepID=A0A4Z0NM60_9HYPH|nr:hypothetical protein [Methylobacterium nonmethylotrophicum]TGD97413.1 hypothetical protein EU555_19800 [Methylobacterium nonmethylotrophicum]
MSHIQKQFKKRRNLSGSEEFTISKEMLYDLIKCALKNVEFDEDWYLERHQDIKQAIEAGEIKNAKEHFIKYGYFEGKLPYRIPVDDNFYLSENQDVRDGVANGTIKSAAEHFYTAGAQEGRLPYRGFSLFEL